MVQQWNWTREERREVPEGACRVEMHLSGPPLDGKLTGWTVELAVDRLPDTDALISLGSRVCEAIQELRAIENE